MQGSTLTERYAYAPDGERIWRETNGAVTRTPFAHYEVEVASNTVTRVLREQREVSGAEEVALIHSSLLFPSCE